MIDKIALMQTLVRSVDMSLYVEEFFGTTLLSVTRSVAYELDEEDRLETVVSSGR